MAYPILGTPKPAFFDSAGDPLASGTITILNPSDDSVKASYPTADDANASTNGTSGDITLDSRGEPTSTQLWGKDGEDYKIVIKDSAASTIYTLTNIRLPGHSRRSTVTFTSADPTPTIAEGSMFITAGTTAITDFDDGQVGDIITIKAASAITITNNSNIYLRGSQNWAMRTNDTLTLAMFEDQVWQEIGRKGDNEGRATDLTTATTLTEADSGTTYFLNSATEFLTTLPSPAAGLRFEFIVKAAPSGASYTIRTTNGDNIMIGGFNELEVDSTEDGPYSATADTITFVDGVAVVGDWCRLVSDGTSWYLTGQTNADGGATLSNT